MTVRMDMIEKVARRLTSEAFDPDEEWSRAAPNFRTGKRMWEIYIPEARAAIAAMREPTPEMIEAAHRLSGIGGAADVWQAMIDEALK